MTASKQHFEMVAHVLAWTPNVEQASRDILAEAFAEAFKASNPRFDRERFLAACKING